MSILVWRSCEAGNEETRAEVQRICGAYGPEGWVPTSPQDICNRILHTVYMGMATQSSSETRSRAKRLAEAIGSYHKDRNIDKIFEAEKEFITEATDCEPKFRAHGGTNSENLLLQNIQARIRMVTAYAMAQRLPETRKRHGGGSLLVLGSGNCDEALRGYYTKVSHYFISELEEY